MPPTLAAIDGAWASTTPPAAGSAKLLVLGRAAPAEPTPLVWGAPVDPDTFMRPVSIRLLARWLMPGNFCRAALR
jgi:hypothetical protein